MKINFIKSTCDSYGSELDEPFRYFGKIISDRFERDGIGFSFEEIEIQLALFSNELKEKDVYVNWYNKLPNYHRGKNMVRVILPVLESEKCMEDVFQFVYRTFKILGLKKKKDDRYDGEQIQQTLLLLETELQNTDLWELNKRYESILRAEAITKQLDKRTARENRTVDKKKLIFKLEIDPEFENVESPSFAPYDKKFCDRILIKLREKNFRLPDYNHLYIKVSDSFENALYQKVKAEKCLMYGIAICEEYDAYITKNETEKKRITFDLIKQGLYDIAKIDKLNIEKLSHVLDEVEKEMECNSLTKI